MLCCWCSPIPNGRITLNITMPEQKCSIIQKQYFADKQNGFYAIIYDFEIEELEKILPYMEEKTGTKGVQKEELIVSHGGKYRIYYFDRRLDL